MKEDKEWLPEGYPTANAVKLITTERSQDQNGGLKAAPKLLEACVFSHKATTLNAEARAKMEVTDQVAELFQLRQPKDKFNKLSLVPSISSVLKSLGLMGWGKWLTQIDGCVF